jgi:glycosyltransferase involved in cell wall biosynthesis
MNNNHFTIVVPVYNAEKWIGQCLDSIITQNYWNFDLIVIDDHSTDDTWEVIMRHGINAIHNTERIGSALANIIKGIKLISQNEQDIVVTVDGDDYLADDNVLSYLNGVYQDDIWFTYGQYKPISGKYKDFCCPLGYIKGIPDFGREECFVTAKNYRKSNVWVTSHLRTFKKWLWDKIDDADLRDENGEYFKIAGDLAYMYPLIEMAGESHIRFIEKILYIYNDLNPNGDGKINPELQINTGKYIQNKPIYKTL